MLFVVAFKLSAMSLAVTRKHLLVAQLQGKKEKRSAPIYTVLFFVLNLQLLGLYVTQSQMIISVSVLSQCYHYGDRSGTCLI